MSADDPTDAPESAEQPAKRPFPLYAYSIAFAFSGHLLAALFLWALGTSGLVDFRAADPSETAAFSVLLFLFFSQAVFVTIGVAQEGFAISRVATGIVSLVFAFGMLMILYVALQCALYDICL